MIGSSRALRGFDIKILVFNFANLRSKFKCETSVNYFVR
jgi:hypothetical protein